MNVEVERGVAPKRFFFQKDKLPPIAPPTREEVIATTTKESN